MVSAPAPDGEGAKKCAAKARQQAIMAQMKAQQEKISLNFEDEGEDNDQDVDEDLSELSSFGTCIIARKVSMIPKHSVLWALFNLVDCSGSTRIAIVSISMSL